MKRPPKVRMQFRLRKVEHAFLRAVAKKAHVTVATVVTVIMAAYLVRDQQRRKAKR